MASMSKAVITTKAEQRLSAQHLNSKMKVENEIFNFIVAKPHTENVNGLGGIVNSLLWEGDA